ncbi:MAG: VWA domain-containing protein [Anaerolineae bacterium]
MEERIARFIAALRASGVRVSVAETQDAWEAITQIGALHRDTFRTGLRATLIKDAQHFPTFDELFAMYFGTDVPPLQNLAAELTPEQQQMLQEAMQQALEQLARDMEQLLDWLMNGHTPTEQELAELAEQAGMDQLKPNFSPFQSRRYARRMQQILGWNELQELLEQLWELLAERGMPPDKIEELKARVDENMGALQERIANYAGMRVQDSQAEEYKRQKPINDLMQRPFASLSNQEMGRLRDEIRRLAARLRSRASLRHKQGKRGKLDAKATLRANLRYGNVPFEIKLKQKRRKPKLVVLLDISTSMRPVAEFFLRLLYELQDQIQKTRSFAFIDHLEDVTTDLQTLQIDEAVQTILTKLPPGYYSTDLGYSLRQFEAEHLDAVDSRTTFIILGDGRNNYNDPALDTLRQIARRARKLIWLNPEYPAQWGTGDSDMHLYQPLCDEIYQVRNLEQLTAAIDQMLG